MLRYFKDAKKWFGYNRRERRSVVVLLILTAIMLFARHFVHSSPDYPVISYPDDIPSKQETSADTIISHQQPPTRRVLPAPQLVKIELNSADSTDLIPLPGIGPVFSSRIVRYRNLLGGFVDVNQLLEVYGLPEETWLKISKMVTADTLLIRTINVNTATFGDLLRHPYINRDNVVAITGFRERYGNIESWQMMKENDLIPEDKASLLRYYLAF